MLSLSASIICRSLLQHRMRAAISLSPVVKWEWLAQDKLSYYSDQQIDAK